MNLLITGANGFVGTHVIRYAQKHFPGYKLFAWVRPGSAASLPKNVTVIESVYEEFLPVLLTHSIHAVLHLAGKAHDTRHTTEADAYFQTNYEITHKLYEAFAVSDARIFVFLSTIKAIADEQEYVANSMDVHPALTPYGQSKWKAEEFIRNYEIGTGKNFYILRPVLIYGEGVKGNLEALVRFIQKGLPYPFANFENKRSYLSVNNLSYLIFHLLTNYFPSGTYNVADEEPISTNELIVLIAKALGKKPRLLKLGKPFAIMGKVGDTLQLPFNTEKLKKLTGSFVVDTRELKEKLGIVFPEKTRESITTLFGPIK